MTKLLGVHIAHGLTSETKVFASLLAEREARYEPCVLMHQANGSTADIEHFAALARTEVTMLDTGWRPNLTGHRLHPGRARVALQYLRRIETSIAVGERFDPDAVYSSQQHYDCRTATRMAAALGVPQIIHLHYIIGPWLRRTVVQRLRTADHVIAVSDFIRREAIAHGVPPEKVTTIRNAIGPFRARDARDEVRDRFGLQPHDFAFLMLSRLDPSKGHFDAIAAFDRFAGRDLDAQLLIAGTGRHEHRIRALAQRSSAVGRIRFLGQSSDVDGLLAASDALLHPATKDPCPLAVLEAMAAALPVVAYADGGVPELVDSGKSGLLAPVGEVAELARLMSLVRRDPDLAARLGRAAAVTAERNFDPKMAGRQFADLVDVVACSGQ